MTLVIIFILIACIAVVAGILIFFFLPSYPEQVGWLTEEEKQLQVRRLGIHSLARFVHHLSSGFDEIARNVD